MNNAKLLDSCKSEEIGDSGGLSQKTAQTSDARFLWKFDFLEIDNLTELKPLAKHSILEVCEDCKTHKSQKRQKPKTHFPDSSRNCRFLNDRKFDSLQTHRQNRVVS